MRPLPTMSFIRTHVRRKLYRLTRHAGIVQLERGIAIADMEQALLNGEIIETYHDDEPYPSCLVLGWVDSFDPLHIVCSRGNIEPALRIVTMYEPDDDVWEGDFKTRKGNR